MVASSERADPGKPYAYTYMSFVNDANNSAAAERASAEGLLSIKQSLLLLTGGCEVTQRPEGPYCEKHSRPLRRGESRCDYVAERFSRGEGEQRSKTQFQHYVNDVLGVKDPKNVKRLTGL